MRIQKTSPRTDPAYNKVTSLSSNPRAFSCDGSMINQQKIYRLWRSKTGRTVYITPSMGCMRYGIPPAQLAPSK